MPWGSWDANAVRVWLRQVCRSLSTQKLLAPAGDKCWQVSSYGRCCNLAGVVLEGSSHPSGYRHVNISGHMFKVHRLVAFAFLGPPPNELQWQVHHRDGNPSNNRLDNLEYVTQSQNILCSYANPSRRTSGNYHSKPVMWRAPGSQSWTTSPSMTHAAEQLGMHRSAVSKACRHGKQAKGFEFQLADCSQCASMVEEEWRQMYDPMLGDPVPGRMVSSLGRIWSKSGKISRGWRTTEGYYRTQLTLSPGKRTESVHRLVAFAFCGPPVNPARTHVNHKDCNKGNNASENLEYVTASENMAHYWANTSSRPQPHGKPVESRRHGSNREWQRHASVTSAAEVLGVHASSISKCLHGQRSQTGGFEFRAARMQWADPYEDEEWRKVDLEAHVQERATRKEKTCLQLNRAFAQLKNHQTVREFPGAIVIARPSCSMMSN